MAANMVDQDQKQRTLDALERRFAVAKADLLRQQQHKSKKRVRAKDERLGPNTNSSSVACTPDAPVTPWSNTPKKGNFAFSGYAKSQDVAEANGPIYTQLSHPVHENLLATNDEISSRKGSTVDKILHELFQSGDAAQKYMQGSRSMKIDNWILLDNFVRGGRSAATSARIRALQSDSKRSKMHLSLKQHKKCGSFELPQELHKFENFQPMHETWKGYITQLLKSVGKNQLAQCLLSADLHGSIILAADCKVASFIGVSGIMIRETAETFGIITQDNKFRVVPKKGSVFVLRADCWKITLHGDKLASRSLSF